MSELTQKLSHVIMEIELFFARLLHRKKKAAPMPETQPNPAKPGEVMPRPMGQVVDHEAKKKAVKLPLALRTLRLSLKDRLFFYEEMATLIASGVNLVESLALVQAQAKKKVVKQLYAEIMHHVNAGLSLSESMYEFPRIFPRMQVALIEAGEKSGNLKLVLQEIVDEMEGQQEFVRKVKGAMFYPIILIVLAVLMVVGMMTLVIPRVAKMYAQSKVALPGPTQTVINISNYVSANWIWLILIFFGGLLLLWFFFSQVMIGRRVWERIIAVLPFFGTISKEKNLMIIAGNMGMLMRSGVLIADAFEITAKTVGNLHYQDELLRIRQGVTLGKPVSELMGLKDIRRQEFENNRYFPIQVAQLLHIGETTGTIAEMMFKLRDIYHKSIDYKLKNISTVIEPIMILFVAALVGSILLAVMLPFFYIGTTIG